MVRSYFPVTWALLGIILLSSACSRPTELGSELLEIDQVDILFTDTLNVGFSNVVPDSVISFDPSSAPVSAGFGYFQDPVMGKTRSDIFVQFTPTSQAPVLDAPVIDSVILTMEIDSTTSYGGAEVMMGLEVFEMAESFDADKVYYSDADFGVKPMALASGEVSSSTNEKHQLVISDTDTVSALMFKLDLPEVFGEFLMDTTVINNFDDEFFGLYLKNTQTAAEEALSSLSMQSQLSGVTVYYKNATDPDTTNSIFRFVVSSIDKRVTHVENDFDGSPLGDVLNGSDTSGEYLYLQGLAGANLELNFSDVLSLGDILVNEAKIILYAVEDEDITPNALYPIVQLIPAVKNDGSLVGVDDVSEGISVFGGTFAVDDENLPEVLGSYTLNVSDYFQKIVDGDRGPIIFLRAFPKINNLARTVVYGPGASNFKPKLELTFTRINI